MCSRNTFAAPWLLLFACGCSIDDDHISAEDDGVFWPALRASIDLDRRGPVPVHTGPADVGALGNLSIDIEVTGTEGDASDHLSAGEQVRFEDLQVDGPADLDIDYALTLASVAFAGSLFFPNGFALTGFVGLAHTRLELDIDAGVDATSETIRGFGPLAGGRVAWFPRSALGLYAQASNRAVFPEEFDWVSVDQIELGIEIVPTPGVALFAGYRWLYYGAEDDDWHSHDDDDDDSELNLEVSGPVVGLALSF